MVDGGDAAAAGVFTQPPDRRLCLPLHVLQHRDVVHQTGQVVTVGHTGQFTQ